MKKHYLLAVLTFLFCSTPVFAEIPKGLGFHGGLNFAEVATDAQVATQSFTAFLLGATYDYSITENIYFVPGVQLIQRGLSFNNGVTDIDYKLTFLKIPLMLQLRFLGTPLATTPTTTGKEQTTAKPAFVNAPTSVDAPKGELIPFFVIGPVFGLKLGSGCSAADGTCYVIRDDSRSFHAGFELGGGAIFPQPSGSAVIAPASLPHGVFGNCGHAG